MRAGASWQTSLETHATETVRVAAVQAEPVWADLRATVDKTVALVHEAANNSARLIAFPELWLPGYPFFIWTLPVHEQFAAVRTYRENALKIDGPELRVIASAARDRRIHVSVGFAEVDHGTLYISQVLFDEFGNVAQHRRKLKPTHVERALFGEGDGSDLTVVETSIGRVGSLSCWEHIQPLVKFALYAQHEQIHVAAWPCSGVFTKLGSLRPSVSLAASATYAVEGGTFVIVANQVLSEDGRHSFGDGAEELLRAGGGYARVIGPDGSQLTEELPPTEEGIVYGYVDLSLIGVAKGLADPVGHYARPDVFQVTINRRRRTSAEFTVQPAPSEDPAVESPSAPPPLAAT